MTKLESLKLRTGRKQPTMETVETEMRVCKATFDEAVEDDMCDELFEIEVETLAALQHCADPVPEEVLTALSNHWQDMFGTDTSDYERPADYRNAVKVAINLRTTRLAGSITDAEDNLNALGKGSGETSECLKAFHADTPREFLKRFATIGSTDQFKLLAALTELADADTALHEFDSELEQEKIRIAGYYPDIAEKTETAAKAGS